MAKIVDDNVMVCVDCGMYIANGEVEGADPRWSADALDRRWEGLQLVTGDSDKDDDFSWCACKGCGSTLGGARMHCVALD